MKNPTMNSKISLSEVKDGLVRIAVAYTGTFQQGVKSFSITLADLEEMANNLSRREVPLDYQHYSGAAAAGQPVPPDWLHAAGWIKRPDKIEDFGEGRKVLWAWAEFTPRCLAAIRTKELRYFSPEFTWAGTNEHGESVGTKLNAGAILIRPFLLDLPPIEISAAEYPELLQSVALSESKRFLLWNEGGKMKNICPTCGHQLAERFATVSAAEELQRGVTALMSEHKIDYASALSRFTRTRPELWQRHIAESTQG